MSTARETEQGAARRKLTSFLMTLAPTEPGRKWVLSVEDWAEIRRLRRAEKMSILQIAQILGISRNTARWASASNTPHYNPLPYPASLLWIAAPRWRARCVRAGTGASLRPSASRRRSAKEVLTE